MSKYKVHTGGGNGHSPGSYYRASNPAVIDPHNEEDLKKWMNLLQLDKKDLLSAIDAYGPEVRNIRRGLRQEQDAA